MLRLYACNHYLDVGKIPEALEHLAAAEDLWDGSTFEKPQDILVEFVFVNAFYKHDRTAADQWWQQLELLPKIEKDADYWRARTALMLLRGDRMDASDAWTQGDALAEGLPSVGIYDATRSSLANLKKALDEDRAAGDPGLTPGAVSIIDTEP